MATFGDTNIEGTATPMGQNFVEVFKATLTEAASATKMSMYIPTAAADTGVCKGVIYATSGGEPAALVAATNETTLSSSAGWSDLMFASPVSLSAADYYIGYFYGTTTNNVSWVFAATGGTRRKITTATYPTAPNPFGTPGTSDSLQMSVYVTYTPVTVTPSSSPNLLMLGLG